jgi:hypothetical protein
MGVTERGEGEGVRGREGVKGKGEGGKGEGGG